MTALTKDENILPGKPPKRPALNCWKQRCIKMWAMTGKNYIVFIHTADNKHGLFLETTG